MPFDWRRKNCFSASSGKRCGPKVRLGHHFGVLFVFSVCLDVVEESGSTSA